MTTLKSSVVRIFSPEGVVQGAGLLVDPKHVVTCAHVVAAALGVLETEPNPPIGEIEVDFPLVQPGSKLASTTAVWHPVGESASTVDIAVLELAADLPSGAAPAALVESDEYWGHSFRAFGFPPAFDQGQWASGLLRDQLADGWVQIEDVKSTGYFVVPGFSGTPVWDEEADGVVGIIVGAAEKAEVRGPFFLPTPLLVQAWPNLSGAVVAGHQRPISETGSVIRVLDAPQLQNLDQIPTEQFDEVFGSLLLAMVKEFFEKAQIVIDRGKADGVLVGDLFAVLAAREEIRNAEDDIVGSVNREGGMVRVIDAQEKISICTLEDWAYAPYIENLPAAVEAFADSEGNIDLDLMEQHSDALWLVKPGQPVLPVPREEQAERDEVEDLYNRTLDDAVTDEERRFLHGEMIRRANAFLLTHGTGYFASHVLFQRGYAQIQLGAYRDAIETFDLFLRRYPFSESADGARDSIEEARAALKAAPS